jgi:hypothetical protein
MSCAGSSFARRRHSLADLLQPVLLGAGELIAARRNQAAHDRSAGGVDRDPVSGGDGLPVGAAARGFSTFHVIASIR